MSKEIEGNFGTPVTDFDLVVRAGKLQTIFGPVTDFDFAVGVEKLRIILGH